YCFGQMQDKKANPVLVKVLKDCEQEPMVRHEAAEALGAIGSAESLEVLQKFTNDPVIEVAETCQLALERIKWLHNPDNCNLSQNPYHSVDPAPPANKESVDELKTILLNEHETLFERYRAMFSLRNLRTKEAVLALGAGLSCGGALFRHEIAFVLGQLQDEDGVPYLKESLENCDENEMVSHECAE
nr:nero [Cucujiformia]